MFSSLKAKDPMEKEEAHSDDFYKEINIKPLRDLHDKSMDEIRDFTKFDPAVSQPFRYAEEVSVDKEAYLESLKFRSSQIELVIDDHISALFDGDKDKIIDNTYNMTYFEKLEFLFTKQS